MQTSDIIVVGAGIAGSSAAAELAREARVCLLEMEAQPGYHATGRSAAYFATSYGKQVIREFTSSCENFLLSPPDGFTETALLTPRDYMVFGRKDQLASLRAEYEANPALEFLDPDAVRRRVPIFAEGYLHGALWDRRGGDLDVDALLQAYLRLFRRRDGLLFKQHRVSEIRRRGDCWRLTAAGRTFEAPVIVNAAGAWVEEVAGLAGVPGLGIKPLRRTALTIPAPAGMETADWPEMGRIADLCAGPCFRRRFRSAGGRILLAGRAGRLRRHDRAGRGLPDRSPGRRDTDAGRLYGTSGLCFLRRARPLD
jgi:D-arginine dehydrogenase